VRMSPRITKKSKAPVIGQCTTCGRRAAGAAPPAGATGRPRCAAASPRCGATGGTPARPDRSTIRGGETSAWPAGPAMSSCTIRSTSPGASRNSASVQIRTRAFVAARCAGGRDARPPSPEAPPRAAHLGHRQPAAQERHDPRPAHHRDMRVRVGGERTRDFLAVRRAKAKHCRSPRVFQTRLVRNATGL
jgi:hypothetical protein